MKVKMIQGNIPDSKFVSGFSNWKDVSNYFKKYERKAAHKAAADFRINVTSTRNAGDMT